MKIVITGGSGQLAGEIKRLVETGGEKGLPLNSSIKDGNLFFIDRHSMDIADKDNVIKLVDQICPHIIINCAAFTNVDACETQREEAFKTNALGPRNLAIASERVGAKLIHISTDYVFDGGANSPYIEWDTPSPQNIYGKSKYLGEKYVRDFTDKFFIVRTAWLYGLSGKNFVKTILRLSKEIDSISVVNDQMGTPTSAKDLASHLLNLIFTDEYGLYHCTGNGEPCTWFDFATEILRLSGNKCSILPCTSQEYPSPVKRPAYSVLENFMLKSTIGDNMPDWKESLKSFLQELT